MPRQHTTRTGTSGSSQLPDKLYFKIGEVAEIVGVKPHVLRYWETEFTALRPKKTRGAHRMYSRKDVELAMRIKRLLHDEGYTVPGARRKLKVLGRHKRQSPPDPAAQRAVALRAELLEVREQLVGLLDELDAAAEESEEQQRHTHTAKVHEVVPSSVPVRRR